MPACQGPQATVRGAAPDSAANSFLYYLYIVSQYTVRRLAHSLPPQLKRTVPAESAHLSTFGAETEAESRQVAALSLSRVTLAPTGLSCLFFPSVHYIYE